MPYSRPTATGAVFLSYASQDAEAAKRICEGLRESGVEVWFDQSELRGGDAWDQSIRTQIKECALFIPVISAHTQGRAEGYFRLEWHLAEQRSLLIVRGRPFIVPVCVDGTNARGALVPDAFLAVQWSKLPGGETPPNFSERVKKLLSGPDAETARQSSPLNGTAAVSHPVRRSRPWLISAVVGAIACAALAYWQPWHSGEKPSAIASASRPQSEVNQLIGRAAAMTTVDATLDDLSKEDYETADTLLEQAKALDPLDGEIWAKEALNDVRLVGLGFDSSPARKDRAATEAARAIELSPSSYSARLARAQVIEWVVAPSGGSQEAEHLSRELLREKPDDPEAQVTLGEILNSEGRHGEAAKLYLQAKLPFLAANAFLQSGRVTEANAAADQALAMKRSAKNLQLKFGVELFLEDLKSARPFIDEIPPSTYTEDKTAWLLVFDCLLIRDSEKALDILKSFPKDWFTTWRGAREPKAKFAGFAHMIAGRPDAARAEWAVALGQIEQELLHAPNDGDLLFLKAECLVYSDQRDEAARVLHLSQQLQGQNDTSVTFQNCDLLLRLGRRDDVMNWLEESLRNPKSRDNFYMMMHSYARFGFGLDPLRGDPRFEKLIRDTLPPYAKPFDQTAAQATSAPETPR
jgi:tetratricopeptide (TPR) repeat protein